MSYSAGTNGIFVTETVHSRLGEQGDTQHSHTHLCDLLLEATINQPTNHTYTHSQTSTLDNLLSTSSTQRMKRFTSKHTHARTHTHRAILINDTDFLSVVLPLHVAHYRLVTVVDHLLKPHAFVQHPHNNETVLVARRQLAVVRVPRHAHYRAYAGTFSGGDGMVGIMIKYLLLEATAACAKTNWRCHKHDASLPGRSRGFSPEWLGAAPVLLGAHACTQP